MSNKVGRPSSYTKEIADKICEILSTTSKSLVSICKSDEMPSTVTVYSWLNNKDNAEFLNNYTRAREAQADLFVGEIIEIADTERKTKTTNSGGDFGSNESEYDNTPRSKLQIDARKWAASKLAPKKYGDKLDVTSGGDKVSTNISLTAEQTAELKSQLNDEC